MAAPRKWLPIPADVPVIRAIILGGGHNVDVAAHFGVHHKTLERRRQEFPWLDQVLREAHADSLAGHGEFACYQRGCRCQDCRAANTRRHTWQRAKRFARAVPDYVTHGRSAYNNWACRCEICFTAHSERMRAYKASLKERAS